MGLAITKERFSEEEFQLFEQRLQENLNALQLLMEREDFGIGPNTLGAELELDLVDKQGRALAINRDVLARHIDPQLQLELTRFNLEYNLLPVDPVGTPFKQLRHQMESALGALRATLKEFDGRVVTIGILPTLRAQDLEATAITDLPRYKALSNGLRRIRRAPFQIRIDGIEPISTTCDDVTLEGANTSFQIHLRSNPADFAKLFNAAQLATPLAVAVSGNSPIFLEHCLWEETRVALFKQAVDSRSPNLGAWRRAARVPYGHGWVRTGAFELFAEAARLFPPVLPACDDQDPVEVVRSGSIPKLSELRMQQGTVWQWNRPVYDPDMGGHLRIELRALPSGPTPVDMMANAAFLIGLTVSLQHKMDKYLPAFPFRYAEYNFYRASQTGLNAALLWPTVNGVSPVELAVTDLIEQQIPQAQAGLESLGVQSTEASSLLNVIRDRVKSRQTASQWQKKILPTLERNLSRSDALAAMVNLYEKLSRDGKPVHDWPLDT